MKKYIAIATLLAAGSAFANATTIANYDVDTLTSDKLVNCTSGGYGAYQGFSFTIPSSVEGSTIGENEWISLESITFARGDSGGQAISSEAYLNIYSSSSLSAGSFLGQSDEEAITGKLNSSNANASNNGKFESVSFSNLKLSLGTTYYVFFSTAKIDDSYAFEAAAASLRLGKAADGITGADRVFKNPSAMEGETWRPIYNVSVSVIPEPSTFGLLAGLGALALVGTRRRRR